jgi:hypothetical protein
MANADARWRSPKGVYTTTSESPAARRIRLGAL